MSQIFWLMNFIPDSIFVYVYYCLLGLGILFYISSKLVSWIPFIKNYKFPVELIGVISLVAGAFLIGGYGVEMSWRQRVKDLEEKIKIAEEKSKEVNTVIQDISTPYPPIRNAPEIREITPISSTGNL